MSVQTRQLAQQQVLFLAYLALIQVKFHLLHLLPCVLPGQLQIDKARDPVQAFRAVDFLILSSGNFLDKIAQSRIHIQQQTS